MLHLIRIHGFALLAAAPALAYTGMAQAQSLVDTVNDLQTLGDGSVREILGGAEGWSGFFDRFSLLEFNFSGTGGEATRQFVAIENNYGGADAPNQRLDRTIQTVLCDGSVRVAAGGPAACDGSVTPTPFIETLTIQGTLNPSIVMGGTLNDTSLNGDSNFGVIATTGLGLPGFDPGTWLGGEFTKTEIFPNQYACGLLCSVVEPPNAPLLDVTVRDLEAMGFLRDFYFIGLIDFGLGGFATVEEALLLRTISNDDPIPQGTERTDFLALDPNPFACPSCTTISAGVGFASPGRGGVEDPGYLGTRTSFANTFRVFEVPPPVSVPAPATLWLLLGGIGMMAAARRRTRHAAGIQVSA